MPTIELTEQELAKIQPILDRMRMSTGKRLLARANELKAQADKLLSRPDVIAAAATPKET